jgi:hypothetical protein
MLALAVPQVQGRQECHHYTGQLCPTLTEYKKGGIGLRYSFYVKSNGALYEVGVERSASKLISSTS